LVVYSCNGVVFDKDRAGSHAKGYENGYAGGESSDQGNTQRCDEFAEQINATHLRIELSKVINIVLRYNNDPVTFDGYGVDDG